MAALFFCSMAAAQAGRAQGGGRGQTNQANVNDPSYKWKFHPQDRAEGDGGPAPKRDLTGTWAGPSSGMAVPRGAALPEPPAYTDFGKQLWDMNKPLGKYSPAGTNDPHVRYCDPFGVPHAMNDEIRGMQIGTMPGKTIMMLNYMNIWREIWTDGRALPTTVGVRAPVTLDTRYNGYSVGHWEDDYNFVIETIGLEPTTWLDKEGHPHSADAKVIERFTRKSKNDLNLHITVVDPKVYKGNFELEDINFRWVPNQQLDDFTCIPSEVQEYLKTMGDPAGSDPNAPEPQPGRGRGGRGR